VSTLNFKSPYTTQTLILGDDDQYNVKIWGSELSKKLREVGLIQTNDTGQVDWSNIDSDIGDVGAYEIFTLPSYLLYFRVDYIHNPNVVTQDGGKFWVSIGYDSDGAGNLIGTTTQTSNLPVAIGQIVDYPGIGRYASVGFNTFMSVSDTHFCMVYKMRYITFDGTLYSSDHGNIVVGMHPDNLGFGVVAATFEDDAQVNMTSSRKYTDTEYINPSWVVGDVVGIYTVASCSTPYYSITPLSPWATDNTHLAVLNQNIIYPWIISTPEFDVFPYGCTYMGSQISVGSVFTSDVSGTMRTYLATGGWGIYNGPIVTGLHPNDQMHHSFAILWE